MTVTAKLLRLYLVDQQIRGLSGRLNAAEKYLAEQDRILGELDASHAALSTQFKLLEATLRNDEVEASAIEQRVALLRDRMNNAKTSKEHSAYLTEVGTLKDAKKVIEDRVLEAMTKTEEMRTKLDEIEAQRVERRKVHAIAVNDRDARAAEIKDRLDELRVQRTTAVADIPPTALSAYEQRLSMQIEDVMAPVEEQDRRNLEYTCGACYTHLPIERVSILLKRGDLTRCTTCQAILYMAQELREDIEAGHAKKQKKSAASAKE